MSAAYTELGRQISDIVSGRGEVLHSEADRVTPLSIQYTPSSGEIDGKAMHTTDFSTADTVTMMLGGIGAYIWICAPIVALAAASFAAGERWSICRSQEEGPSLGQSLLGAAGQFVGFEAGFLTATASMVGLGMVGGRALCTYYESREGSSCSGQESG